MKHLICTAAIALMGALSPLPATAQTATTILQEMQASQTAQAANVPLYVTRTNAGIVGAPTQTLLFRALETNSGTTTYTMVLPDEIQSMLNERGYKTNDAIVKGITLGSAWGLDGIRNSGRDDSAEMADAFLDSFGGLLSPLADYRDFEELQYAEENDRMDASVDQVEFEQFISMANYVGLTDVRGAQAYHLHAENIGMKQVTPDGEYTSSPPRPKMKGSPPVSRSTFLPACASSIREAVMLSSLAALASARIPATMRGISRSITLATGHAAGTEDDLDWRALANLGQPIIVYIFLKMIV